MNLSFYLFRSFAVVLLSFLTNLSLGQSKVLSPDQFQETLHSNPMPQLIDIRSLNDYNTGHIKKAVDIDLTNPDFEKIILKTISKTKPVFIYCQSGSKSEDALVFLEELGYNNNYVLKGGFENWIQAAKPYVSSSNIAKPLGIINPENFGYLTRQNKWVLVNFIKENCDLCYKNLSISYKIKTENKEISVVKIDAAMNQTLAEKYEVLDTPTLLIFKYGRQVWKQSGDINEADILTLIN